MTQPIVLQLQELASDSSHDLGDVLRKALTVATKLRLEEFRKWTSCELNGYTDPKLLPEYRIVKGDLRVHNPMHGLIPFVIEDPEIAAAVKRRGIFESVSAIQQSMKSRGEIAYSFSPEAEASLMRMQKNNFVALRPMLVVGHNQMAAIIECVRTKLLDWALTLEQEGILGDGLSFSEREKSIATSQSIRIDNFQGVLGNVSHGGQVLQNNSITVVKDDFDSLSTFLKAQGVDSSDLVELQEAVAHDPAPSSVKSFGPRVSSWVGRMLTKAADGSWEISIATGGALLASALAKYYGL